MIATYKKLNIQKMNQEQLNDEFINQCRDGDIETIKYLLTSPDLEKHAEIHSKNDFGIMNACVHQKLKIVDYLLKSSELKEHANIHVRNDVIFKNACHHNRWNIIEYFIFDYQIDKTKEIEKYLVKQNKINILNMFDKRELEKRIQKDLQKNAEKYNKIKL